MSNRCMADCRLLLRALAAVAVALACSAVSYAHPMGNFSISHYAAIRLMDSYLELRYILDEAEIPTFQEMQRAGFAPQVSNSRVASYLRDQGEALKSGLHIELDGQPLILETVSTEVIFPPGAGGLPTMRLGIVYRATLGSTRTPALHQLYYRDDNYRDRAGWKEIVATAPPSVAIVSASVPAADQSDQLTNYPTDLLNSPPQALEAEVTFNLRLSPAAAPTPTLPPFRATQPSALRREAASSIAATNGSPPQHGATASLALKANQQSTPRNAFTELMRTQELSISIVLLAALVALGLGALHALEPGHGKTLVAAYLVGSRGTALHAFLLGLIVTVSHTAGVFLLGAVTLYAQRYIVPEQLYPWLGVVSGLTISLLGIFLILQRYLGLESDQLFAHSHGGYRHGGSLKTRPDEADASRSDSAGSVLPGAAVSFRQLLALGITGGMVPCPAALVVLLSAVALHRVGFGLFLIVVFSAGLAAVLVMTGMLVVFASRVMTWVHPEDPWLRRWLPLASAGAVTALGFVIALRALLSASLFHMQL